MKKVLLLLILFMSMSLTYAAEFRYIGSKAKVCAYTFDGKYYLILSFADFDDYKLTNSPIVKFLLNDGTIIKLNGYDEAVKITSTAFNWGGGISTGSSKENHYVLLPISKEQIDKLVEGVDRIAINTIPKVYKKSNWSNKKKFGALLYVDFMELSDDFNIQSNVLEDYELE